jgi:hypothetical protein
MNSPIDPDLSLPLHWFQLNLLSVYSIWWSKSACMLQSSGTSVFAYEALIRLSCPNSSHFSCSFVSNSSVGVVGTEVAPDNGILEALQSLLPVVGTSKVIAGLNPNLEYVHFHRSKFTLQADLSKLIRSGSTKRRQSKSRQSQLCPKPQPALGTRLTMVKAHDTIYCSYLSQTCFEHDRCHEEPLEV